MSDMPPVAPIMVGGYGSPGGYKFSDDEVDSVIKQWEDLLTDLRNDRLKATQIAEVLPPGDEPASHNFVETGVNPSGQSLKDEHQAMYDYVNNYITALHAAKNKISVAEQQNRDAMNQTGA
jgi:hypothetical protein